jgi:hypothetical protein
MAKKTVKNPNNPTSRLYRQLTRLLSGPLAVYDREQPRQLKSRQYNNLAGEFKSASGQSFKREDYNPYQNLAFSYMANQMRGERYVDFDQMEFTPEIASSLDIYADEITTSNELNDMLNIKTNSEEIKGILENLFLKIMNLEFNLFGWARAMCKYGDFFLYLDIDDKEGIKYAVGLPSNEVERLEGEDKTNPKYVQFQWNQAAMTFENWQVAHFRILGNDKYVPYGTSVLEPARRIWRQLTLMEDAVMAYRIVRSPERRVFYVDVGSIAPQDVEQYMQRVITQMKRNQIVNATTGRVDLRYNPMSTEEDYFIPVRGGEGGTRIENLPGGTYTGDIDDIKYLRDKLFAALKIPASYLSRAEGESEDKTTLAQKDVRFARTIQRLQKSVVSELEKIAIIHLFTLGYRGQDLINFKLTLNNPSKLAELQELEHWRTKFDVASAATEGYFSRRWVFENIFNVSEKETLRMQRERFFDKKLDLALEQSIKAEEAAMGTDLTGGTELEGGGFDLGGGTDAGGGAESPAAPEEEEDVLLATPGEEMTEAPTPGPGGPEYTRKGWKGKMHKSKRRNKQAVARRKNIAADVTPLEQGSRRTERGTWTGSEIRNAIELPFQGYLSEGKDSNYIEEGGLSREEKHIFKSKLEIDSMLEGLEIKINETKTQ